MRRARRRCAVLVTAFGLGCAGLGTPPEPLPPVCAAEEGSLDAELAPRVRVEASYPRAAARMGRNGYACLNFTVQPDGRVTDICVSDAQPPELFDRASVAALEQWRFTARDAPIRSGTCFMFDVG